MDFGKKLKIFFRGKLRTRHTGRGPRGGIKHYVMIAGERIDVPKRHRSPRRTLRRKSAKKGIKCGSNSKTCEFYPFQVRSPKTGCHCKNRRGYHSGVEDPRGQELMAMAVAMGVPVMRQDGNPRKESAVLREVLKVQRFNAKMAGVDVSMPVPVPMSMDDSEQVPMSEGVDMDGWSDAAGFSMFGRKRKAKACKKSQYRNSNTGKCRTKSSRPCKQVGYLRSPKSRKCYPKNRALRDPTLKELLSIAYALDVPTVTKNPTTGDYYRPNGKPMPELKSKRALKARFTKMKLPYPSGPRMPRDVNPEAWAAAEAVGMGVMQASANEYESRKAMRAGPGFSMSEGGDYSDWAGEMGSDWSLFGRR